MNTKQMRIFSYGSCYLCELNIIHSVNIGNHLILAVKKPRRAKSPAQPQISAMYKEEDGASLTGSTHTLSSDGTPTSPQSTRSSRTSDASTSSKTSKQAPAATDNTARGGLTGL